MTAPTSARAYRARVGFGRTVRPYPERLAASRALAPTDAERATARERAVERLRKRLYAPSAPPERQEWHRRKMAQHLKGQQ